jgi:hypothetical protein
VYSDICRIVKANILSIIAIAITDIPSESDGISLVVIPTLGSLHFGVFIGVCTLTTKTAKTADIFLGI